MFSFSPHDGTSASSTPLQKVQHASVAHVLFSCRIHKSSSTVPGYIQEETSLVRAFED